MACLLYQTLGQGCNHEQLSCLVVDHAFPTIYGSPEIAVSSRHVLPQNRLLMIPELTYCYCTRREVLSRPTNPILLV